MQSATSGHAFLGEDWGVFVVVAVALMVTFVVLDYVRTWYQYHYTYRHEYDDEVNDRGEIPPLRPSLIPFLGNIIPFAWDNAGFIRCATTFAGGLRPCRVSIFPGFQVYLFRDQETVKQILKHPAIGSTIPLYIFVLRRFFAMPERAIKVYAADNSGPGSKPLPGSNVAPDARPFYTNHKDLVHGLTGPGLGPNLRRYVKVYAEHVWRYSHDGICQAGPYSSEWTQFPDLFHFAQHTVGSAMIAAHFGPALLSMNPGYMADLWKFDSGVPWFARCVPRFLLPGPYRARDRMIENLMDWYQYARDHFDESSIDEDGDGDPAWGSGLSRRRQKSLREVKEHDDRVVASLDFGHSWGSTSNITSAIFMATYYIFSSPPLLDRLRTSLSKTLGVSRVHSPITNSNGRQENIQDVLDPKVLQSDALLCSIYAETLRLHSTTSLILRTSAMADAHLGRWQLPRGSTSLVSTYVMHQDSDFWNTRQGRHPVSEFWSDRFLVYPHDPDSGPVNPAHRSKPYSCRGYGNSATTSDGNQSFYFTMEGTEGAWYPYGGGQGICLGRFWAKNSIMVTLAYLVLEFDIEPQVESMVVDTWRFGLGINQPKNATPFRMRKRVFDEK